MWFSIHPGEEVGTPVFEGPQPTGRQHLTTTLLPSSRPTTSPHASPRRDEECLVTFTAQLPQPDKDKGNVLLYRVFLKKGNQSSKVNYFKDTKFILVNYALE